MKVKYLLILAALLLGMDLHAQQPQTSTAPIFAANAKYTNGVAPGYWPTAGSGLTLNISAGTANCGGTIASYSGGTLTMSASSTNYVYLGSTANCAPVVSTTKWTTSDIPVATVVTSGSAITSITDDRTMFTSLVSSPTPSFVQHQQTGTNSLANGAWSYSTTMTLTAGSAVTIMLESDGLFSNALGVGSGSCSDNQGDTVTNLYLSPGNWTQINVYIVVNAHGGSTTITCSGTASGANFLEMSAVEWKNVASASVVDASNFANGNHSASNTSWTFPLTTTNASDLLLIGMDGGGICGAVPPSGFSTVLSPCTVASDGSNVGYFAGNVTTAGSYTPTVTAASGGSFGPSWVGFALALKATAPTSAYVQSFNGRQGIVVPSSGDYTCTMVTNCASQAAVQQESYIYAADTGVANAYAVTLSPAPAITAGSEVVFKATNANTGGSTLAVNGGTATAIYKNGNSTALASGDITAGQMITVKYDGTAWQMVAPGSGGGGGGMSNPMTTAGDMIVGGTSGTPTRVAAGTATNVWTSNGPGVAPTWQAPGSVSFQPSVLPVPPSSSSWTWVNQGTASVSNNGNALAMTVPDNSTANWRLLTISTAATPYSYAAYWSSVQFQSSSQATGTYLYDGTKILGLEILTTGSTTKTLRVLHCSDIHGTTCSVPYSISLLPSAAGAMNMPDALTGGMCSRWRNNGTTIYADISPDCANWTNIYSEAVGSFITPTRVGFGGISVIGGGSSLYVVASLRGWLQTSSAGL